MLHKTPGDFPRNCPFPLKDPGPHLIYATLRPPEYTSLTSSQSVQPFLHSLWLSPTDTLTSYICNNRLHTHTRTNVTSVGWQVTLCGMWVPVAVWQPWKLLYTCYLRTYLHTRLTALCPGLSRWAGTRKVKPIWILLKRQWVAVASAGPYASLHLAPDTTQISVFYRPDALLAAQPTVPKHWRQNLIQYIRYKLKETSVNM